MQGEKHNFPLGKKPLNHIFFERRTPNFLKAFFPRVGGQTCFFFPNLLLECNLMVNRGVQILSLGPVFFSSEEQFKAKLGIQGEQYAEHSGNCNLHFVIICGYGRQTRFDVGLEGGLSPTREKNNNQGDEVVCWAPGGGLRGRSGPGTNGQRPLEHH
jgi:hypothetical protein